MVILTKVVIWIESEWHFLPPSPPSCPPSFLPGDWPVPTLLKQEASQEQRGTVEDSEIQTKQIRGCRLLPSCFLKQLARAEFAVRTHLEIAWEAQLL